MGQRMNDSEPNSGLKRRACDYWFFYGDFIIVIILGWIAFFAFKYYGDESKYLNKAIYFLILGTIYAIFSFFRIFMSKKLDNDMLP